jgi:Ala-tRNA(Pro) deacylase
MDEELDDAEDIYCEGGDHLSLVHMKGREFRELMSGAERAHFVA